MDTTNPDEPVLRLHRSGEPIVPLLLVLYPSGLVLQVEEPDVLVGRHSEAGLRLALPDVSRRHCRLQYQAGKWTITDLNSLNGVQVNGQSVKRATIQHGDYLRIGGFTFMVQIGQASHVQSILQTLRRKAS
ncbi:MAG: FHA domain-containing protein [Gemmataceae bacterium]